MLARTRSGEWRGVLLDCTLVTGGAASGANASIFETSAVCDFGEMAWGKTLAQVRYTKYVTLLSAFVLNKVRHGQPFSLCQFKRKGAFER